MKRIAILAALALAATAWAQEQKPAPQEPEKKPVAETKDEPKNTEPARMASRKRPNPKRFEDARHCLDLPTNLEIIKCAEEYL